MAAAHGDGDDAVVLARRVVHAARVALVLHAQQALGVAGLGRVLRRGDGLRVLLRLGEVDGDDQVAVFRRRQPAHVLLDAIAADVVGVLGKPVIPVRCLPGRFRVQFGELRAHLPGRRGQYAHQLGVQKVPAGDVAFAGAPLHRVVQQHLQDLLQRRLGGLRVLIAVQAQGVDQLVDRPGPVALLDQAPVDAVLGQRGQIAIDVHPAFPHVFYFNFSPSLKALPTTSPTTR